MQRLLRLIVRLNDNQKCKPEGIIEHFGIVGCITRSPIVTTKLMVNLKAYNLLRKEFLPEQDYTTKGNLSNRLKIPIVDFQDIGRFILEMLGDVEVWELEELKAF